MYKKVKEKKNLNWLANIGIYSQISVTLSSNFYYLLYNTINLITYDEDMTRTTKGMIDLSLTANVIYSLITILLISYYKDVIFALILMIIEIGYIINIFINNHEEGFFSREKITSLVVVSIITLSIITSVVKYGKSVMGYERDNDIENLLDKYKQKEFLKRHSDF